MKRGWKWTLQNYPLRIVVLFGFFVPLHLPFALLGLVPFVSKYTTKVQQAINETRAFQWAFFPVVETNKLNREDRVRTSLENDIGGRILKEDT